MHFLVNFEKFQEHPLLTHLALILPSHRNRSIDLDPKRINWFTYDCKTAVKWINSIICKQVF